MLRSESLFGKRDNGTPNPSPASTSTLGQNGGSGTVKTSATAPMPIGGTLNTSIATNNATATNTTMSTNNEPGSKLIVGPNIKLKGVEITDCDTIVVEGRVEATIDSRVIQISEQGAFKGSAEVDIAEIRGDFEGDITVRQKLVIHASGKVSGKVRYGKVVIEEGGQLSGDIQVGTAAAGNTRNLSVAKAAQ